MLCVENLDLAYGAAQVLRKVSLTAEIGEVTCVLGRNGVGKTSLMRSIVGHHRLTSGSVAFEGKALDRSAARWWCPAGAKIWRVPTCANIWWSRNTTARRGLN